MRSSRASRVVALFALSSCLAACGAKTGLRVPDASFDAPDVIDVLDAPDVHDVPDVMDVRDVRDVMDVRDVPDVPDAPVCIPGRFTLERTSAEIMFVIDRSGSMGFTLDGRRAFVDELTRWRILREAFARALPPIERTLPFGAKFYPRVLDPSMPQPSAVSCSTEGGVDLAPALSNTAAVLRVFDDTDPFGPTPTWEALDKTIRFLRARPGRGVSRSILLATDGGPNCAPMRPAVCRCTNSPPSLCNLDNPDNPDPSRACLDDLRTLALIRDAAQTVASGQQPIPVFVVGIDTPVLEGPDFRDVLEAMAQAGGRPRRDPGSTGYYSIQRPEDLSQAVDAVIRSVQRCSYVTPSRPDDPDAIDVEIDGALSRRDTTRSEGWDWTDRDFGELTFFGAACERVARAGSEVRARVGCRDE